MSHGWIKERYLREEVGRGVRYKETTNALVRAYRLLVRDSNGDVGEAGVGATDVAAIHVGSTSVASGAEAPIALGGVVTAMPDVDIADNDLLKVYAAGTVGPLLTAALAGTDMSAGGQTGSQFTNQPANDGVEVLSSSNADTMDLTIYGTTNGTVTVVKETVTLTGTTPVATTKVDWGNILGVEIPVGSPTAAGTITVREASGDLTITTLAPAARRSGIYVVPAADGLAYLAKPDVVADGATTQDIGIVGTDSTGAEQLEAVALTGATLVSFTNDFRTVTKLLLGDVESARTATLTVDANADSTALQVGRARAAALAGATAGVEMLLELGGLSDQSVTADKLDPAIEASVTTTLSSAQILALNATPIELVPAPGAGKALIFLGAQLDLTYNTATYVADANEDLVIRYTDGSGAIVTEVEQAFIESASTAYRWAYPVASTTGLLVDLAPVANAPLVAHMLTGEVITGDSDVKIKVFYRVVDLAL